MTAVRGLRENPLNFRIGNYVVLAITCAFAPLSVDLIAPALPVLAEYFSVSIKSIQFSVFVYLAGYAVGPFFWGVASDKWGRNPAMVAGLLGYILTSIVCGLVKDINFFILARFLQGFAAAAGVVISRAILRDIFGKAGVTRAVSTMYLWVVLIPVAAPLIGGYMVYYMPWYYAMFFMGSIGVFTLFFYRRLFSNLPTPKQQHAGEPSSVGLWRILANQTFSLSALANMFVISIMVIFATNYSQLAGSVYGLNTHQLGYLLALFNGSVAMGFFLARMLLVHVSVLFSLLLGSALLLSGWLIILSIINFDMSAELILVVLVMASLGKGMLMSLCAGEALIPFASGVGKASACYTLIQSLGSTLIAFCIAAALAQTMEVILVAVVSCAALAFAAILCLNFSGDERQQAKV